MSGELLLGQLVAERPGEDRDDRSVGVTESSTEIVSPATEEVAYWKGRIGETMLVRTASDREPWEPRRIARVCGRYVFFAPDVTVLDAFSFDVYGKNFKEAEDRR